MTLEQLQEQRNKLAAEVKTLAEKFDKNGKKWADGDADNWKRANADYDKTIAEMDQARAVAEVERRAAEVEERQGKSTAPPGPLPGLEPGKAGNDGARTKTQLPTEEERALALAGFCRNQVGFDISDEHVAAMRLCRINPAQRVLNIALPSTHYVRDLRDTFTAYHRSVARQRCLAETRDLSAITYAAGGALVPETLLRRLEVNMLAFGGMRQVAETIVTASGEPMTWPTADDTTNTGEQLGESTSIGSSVDPTFGGITWDAYKFSSKPILVPYELLEDSFLDLPSVLGDMLGERLGRITNTKYTTGSGANTPHGIVTAASLGVTAASATAITYDEVIRLEHSVDPAYRTGAGYMCHDNVVLALRLLKDGEGQYLWMSGANSGTPDRLNGHPFTVNQDMASSITNSAKTLLYGQLSKYKIRKVNGMRFYRLQERYRDTDQDAFIAFIREDGDLLNAGTAPVKYLQQLA